MRKRVWMLSCACTGLMTVLTAASPVFAATVTVELRDGAISPSGFQAAKGERVDVRIVNRGSAVHNFVIPDFYIFTSNLQPGETTTAGFEPDKSGRFAYYSDKDGTPEPGMTGHMTVTE